MNSIGGFLALELPRKTHRPYHEAVALSTGRSCFYQILQILRPQRVLLPCYVCDALLGPPTELGISVLLYRLDRSFELAFLPELTENEVLVYVNYFGLKTDYAEKLRHKYGDRLVLDDSQAFFQKGYENTWSFNSARKFFGVPDGAYFYVPEGVRLSDLAPAIPGYDHLIERLVGDRDKAYRKFLQHEATLSHYPRGISKLSTRLLGLVDYQDVAKRRRENFMILHDHLAPLNLLRFKLEEGQVPLYYPFLSHVSLHSALIEHRIFLPRLWPEVEGREGRFEWERELSLKLAPLPIDQRYGTKEMLRVVELVSRLLH